MARRASPTRADNNDDFASNAVANRTNGSANAPIAEHGIRWRKWRSSHKALLNNVARIYETEIGDQESAFYVLQAAFKRDYSHDDTAHELERLATATNRWQELLDEYTNRVNELEREDRGSASDLWVKIGRWYGQHLGHLEYAIASEQQALALDPNHREALRQIAELYRKTQKWGELGEMSADQLGSR